MCELFQEKPVKYYSNLSYQRGSQLVFSTEDLMDDVLVGSILLFFNMFNGR